MEKEKIKISIQIEADGGWVEEFVYKGEEKMERILEALNKLKLEIED